MWKLLLAREPVRRVSRLQLSHILTNVETPFIKLELRVEGRASIEPHSYECGNEHQRRTLLLETDASIEPHSYECGNGEKLSPTGWKSFRFN